MKNPFLIEPSEYLDLPEYNKVQVSFRFFIFLIDLTIFSLLYYITLEFLKKFTETEYSATIPIIIFSFYSLIYIIIEYYFDGSIVKILFGIRNVSKKGTKIPFLYYLLKFILRFIALILGYLYLVSLLIVLLIVIRLFGGLKEYYGYSITFIDGRMKDVWYDDSIGQNVIFIKK